MSGIGGWRGGVQVRRGVDCNWLVLLVVVVFFSPPGVRAPAAAPAAIGCHPRPSRGHGPGRVRVSTD